MLVLSLDTSTPTGSVALLEGDEVLGRAWAEVKGKHGEHLIETLAACLEAAGRTLADVELLAVGIGPGSFTGVRVGVATVKGLALSRGLPLVGVVSLAAIARGTRARDGAVAPIVHAHRGEVYAALYTCGEDGPMERLAPFHALPVEAAARLRQAADGRALLAVGDGYRRFEEALGPALGPHETAPETSDLPSAEAVAREGLRRFRTHGPDDTARLEPLYVRPSDAKLPAIPLDVG